MECRDFALQMDDCVDGRLDAARQQSMQEHLEHCPHCRRSHRHAAALQAALRTLPAPASRPGFADQVLARASGAGAGGTRHARRAVLGRALAASLVLGLGVAVFLAMQPAPAQTVALTIRQPESVRLMFNSAKPLLGATLSLTLPENVELVGYGNRRELIWQTDLREGGNLLQLPLVVREKAKGELVARVSHGTSSKTFRLKIEVRQADKAGKLPVGLAS